MSKVLIEQKCIQQFVNGYKIERNYGDESMKSCMVQIIRMVVAQNLLNEKKVVL